MTFADWMGAVDAALRDRVGLTTRDLPGVAYRDL
jgi:hypothetical protein